MSDFTPKEKMTVASVKRFVEGCVAKKPILERWSSEGDAGCIDYARQLKKALEKEGLLMTEQEGSGHISLTDDLSRKDGDKIIVDPSYSQFLHYDPNLGIPPILVGTVGELRRFFLTHRNHGTNELKKDPDAFVDALYVTTEKPKYSEEDELRLKKYG